jgi:type II secretory pathway pseudopilin PulG
VAFLKAMTRLRQIERRRPAQVAEAEAGFMLVFVVLLVALLLIALAVAAPVVAKDLRRDKEVESEHRAEQYVRAIRLYYRRNKSYPTSMEALENTNNVRYLRKRYVDPLTGKDDWRIIHVGENKTTVKGFFGQPLGGLETAGAGSLGAASTTGSSFGGAASTTTSTIGATSGLAAGFQGASIGSSGAGGPGSSLGTPAGSSTSGAGSDSSGEIGPIMGVGTSKTGPSILNPNGQSTYETWEFLYDPKIELMYAKASILGGGMSAGSATSLGDASTSGNSNPLGGSNATPTAGSTTTSPNSPTSSSPF